MWHTNNTAEFLLLKQHSDDDKDDKNYADASAALSEGQMVKFKFNLVRGL